MGSKMTERAQQVANEIWGTPDSLHSHATEREINDPDFCAELDRLVFECVECGWWCNDDDGRHDRDDGFCCDDCWGEY